MKARTILCLLLAALTLVCCFSCDKTPGETTETTGDTTPSVVDGKLSLLNEDGTAKYRLVRPDVANDYEVAAAAAVNRALTGASGMTYEFVTDFEKNRDPEVLSTYYEILVGNTNRQESDKALEGLGDNDYIVKVIDNKIVINSKSMKGIKTAANLFIEQWLGDGKTVTVPEGMESRGEFTIELIELSSSDRPCIPELKYPQSDVVIADIVATDDKYGADPTGEKDSKSAIQKALNDVSKAGGGTVFLPAGKYKVTGSISVPPFCTLRGDWQDPEKGTDYGTVILDYQKSGTTDFEQSLFIIGGSAGVRGLTVFYPEQSLTNVKQYPYTFYTTGAGTSYMLANVQDVTVINGYMGIGACKPDTNAHEQFTIDNVKGTFLFCGAEAYNQADVGTWKNLSIGPQYWANAGSEYNAPSLADIKAYTKKNTTGLILAGLEWTEFSNTQVASCKVGVDIVHCNRIQFAGSLFDFTVSDCGIGLYVEDMDDRWGMVVGRSSFEGSEYAILNKTGGRVKMVDVKTTGKVQGPGEITNDSTSLKEYKVDYNRSYTKPVAKLYTVDFTAGGDVDISADLQLALTEVGKRGGGVLYIPAGVYLLDAPVSVPAGVELRGASSVANRGQGGLDAGTLIISAYGMGGKTSDTALVTLAGENSGVNGIRFTYYKNGPTICKNTPYVVRGKASGVYMVNCGISAAANGVDFSGCDNHFIKKLVGCCYSNMVKVGGKNGYVEGNLQNGTAISRSNVPNAQGWISEGDLFTLLFDPITRQRCTYMIIDKAEGEVVYNTFCYGCNSLLRVTNSKDVFLFNLGADNIGGVYMSFQNSFVSGCNLMRYNGSSYNADKASGLAIYNRLTIGDKNEKSLLQ